MTDEPPIDLAERRRKAKARKQAPELSADLRERWLDITIYEPEWRGVKAGDWRDSDMVGPGGLPKDCPVTPLGSDEGATYFLSARKTISALPAKMAKGDVDLLFSPCKAFPVWAWPQFDKKGRLTGNFKAEEARQDLFAAAVQAGPWDPLDQVRGRGAWVDEESGELILHLGTQLLTLAGPCPLGQRGRYVYPSRPVIAPPAASGSIPADLGEHGPGHALMEYFRTWQWVRGDTDAQLLMGWLACAFVGGALRWRPYIFLTGDHGTGKSTLLDLIKFALGEGGMLKAEDATEAGIAQTLGFDSLPVLLDEMENELDGRRASNIIKMARRAASGSQRIRGGQDHKSSSFVIRSCFIFGAMNTPTLEDQDLSRMALLCMRPFDTQEASGSADAKKVLRARFDARKIEALGRAIHRQVIDWFAIDPATGLPKFEHLLKVFREALVLYGGHNERGADTFGYLMAGYIMATETEIPPENIIRELIEPLHHSTLVEYENIKSGWRKCLDFLMDCQPRAMERQAHTSVRALLEAWRDNEADDAPPNDLHPDTPKWLSAEDVNKKLARVGLLVKFKKGEIKCFINAKLFVPNSNPALAILFEKTPYKTDNPASAGQWSSKLRGAPGHIAWVDRARHGHVRGTSIALQQVMDPIPASSRGREDD